MISGHRTMRYCVVSLTARSA